MTRRPTPSSRRDAAVAYVANDAAPMSPAILDGIDDIKALTVHGCASMTQSLGAVRGYAKDDLNALAEVGYHYLMNGATDLALIIFEGLEAVDPSDAYFALGTGLALDNDGDLRGAMRAYQRAASLDPRDARPDINRAELFIANKDRRSAEKLLTRALEKARRSGDMELFRKAKALLSRVRTTV